ncbi:hypothetical protein [Gaiella sp.]|jgi:hypothetical protein|uniref:hypothetical protein n=1 Tax=Gaiella sp. TaxID=2663207 RepID=UPI002E313B4E|nr:hypothetical protein [Gaiella sp.]
MTGVTPDITEAEVVRHGTLRVTFADGTVGDIDVLERMRGPVFDQARTADGFRRLDEPAWGHDHRRFRRSAERPASRSPSFMGARPRPKCRIRSRNGAVADVRFVDSIGRRVRGWGHAPLSSAEDASWFDALRAELDRTADIADSTEEMLEIAGVVDAALRSTGIRPVVVGGLAVAYWTTGLYLTADIDVVMPHTAEIDERLFALGFEREGRFWTLPGRKPVFEAPGSRLEFDPAGFTDVELASGRTVRVQDVEEVLLLRVDEFVATGNADVFQQCLWLLGTPALDSEHLERRAGEQRLGSALAALTQTAQRIEHDAATLELWEITDIAKALRSARNEP